MPWATGYSDDNKIIDSKDFIRVVWAGVPAYGVGAMEKTDELLSYRYTGMTYAAAETCQTALNDPPDVTAQLKRQNAADAYQVFVIELTSGTWSFVEPA